MCELIVRLLPQSMHEERPALPSFCQAARTVH